ncbi:MAG: transposase [Candidatus Lokiarchaeota archaeon]|nr:transposase [Candidatus Lokiarchaeota archaeon]
MTPANVHDSNMLQPLIESIEENLPEQRIGSTTGDKAYKSDKNDELLKDKKIKSELIPKEDLDTRPEKIKRKKLHSKRSLIETLFGLLTTQLNLEQPRLRGIDAVNFNTTLIIIALYCVNIVASKIGRADKINCPTFFFQ